MHTQSIVEKHTFGAQNKTETSYFSVTENNNRMLDKEVKLVHFKIDKTSVNKPEESYKTTKTTQNCFVFQLGTNTAINRPIPKMSGLQYTVVELMYNFM